MRQDIEKKVNVLLAQPIMQLGYELLGCEYLSHKYNSMLRLYIDSEEGITVQDCQKVMEYIKPLLDVEQIGTQELQLEVSSPGVDRPLFVKGHFLKVIGQEIMVKTQDMLFERRRFRGILYKVDDNTITLSENNEHFVLPFDKILKANVISKFDGFKKGKKL